jgi:hypothetical protein
MYTGATIRPHPVFGIDTVRQAISSGNAFLWELIAGVARKELYRLTKVPRSAAMQLFPFSGGSLQLLDRQIRYYSLTAWLASDLLPQNRF